MRIAPAVLAALLFVAGSAAPLAQADAAEAPSMEWIWPIAAGALVAAAAAVPVARTRRMRTVFLSYRRSDSAQETRDIRLCVARRFGSSRVFHDVRSIRPGEPFRTAIERTLRGCDAALVIIGPQWTTCTNEDGTRRLHAPDDLVRAEVATALRSGALVVPVLVRGAEPPQAADLPADLTGLSGIQAVRLDASRSLEDELSGTLQAIAAAPVRRTPLMLVGAHLSAASFPFVFYQGDGLLVEEFTTTLAIVLPPLAACLAVAAAAWARNVSPARVRHVRAAELFVPMIFVAAIAALVLAKAFNIGIGSFESFKRLLVATEVAFSAYTGLALASMFENRSES